MCGRSRGGSHDAIHDGPHPVPHFRGGPLAPGSANAVDMGLAGGSLPIGDKYAFNPDAIGTRAAFSQRPPVIQNKNPMSLGSSQLPAPVCKNPASKGVVLLYSRNWTVSSTGALKVRAAFAGMSVSS